MNQSFATAPADFVGRDELFARFRARLDHFSFFIYEGISGIGKTALLLRLAKEAKPAGITQSIYLPLVAGENIYSLLARIQARLNGPGSFERPADPQERLVRLLDEQKVVVLLDELQHLRREDLLALVRASRAKPGKYRILAASRGDPELSAMDRMEVYLERVGPLNANEVKQILTRHKVKGPDLERLLADAARGGCSAHPLTLHFLLELCGKDLPPQEFFSNQTARSVNAFKAFISGSNSRLSEEERQIFIGLTRVGAPLSKVVAQKLFGAALTKLLSKGLLTLVDGDVYVHELVSQYVTGDFTFSKSLARSAATHLNDKGNERHEPHTVLRAAQLLALVDDTKEGVDILMESWELARDLGFLETFLKAVAAMPVPGASFERRLKLLAARARMGQGNPMSVCDEMLELSKEKDTWVRSQALASLVSIYSQAGNYEEVVRAFEQLRQMQISSDILINAGTLAAQAMVRIGKEKDAEELAPALLSKMESPKQAGREGELRRLLARLYAQSGRLSEAVEQAQKAATAFEQAGDLYHAALAQGFIGDLYRETGDFELAQTSFKKFNELAQKGNDRNLQLIAELTDAWVLLDIGDLTAASKRIAAVEKEVSGIPSRRLNRYLAAARGLLEAGRGHHEQAANILSRVVDLWDSSGQKSTADVLRAQWVRSLIATGKLEEAHQIVQKALQRLDAKTAAPRVAIFLRESALIHLRRKEVKRAMDELAQARKYFAQGGNRREEVLTLYRIGHAALEDGDIKLASERAEEALALGKKIKHARAVALAKELLGRLALLQGNAKAALTLTKDANSSLRKLGDELGTLHSSDSYLRALVAVGDMANTLRVGTRLSEQAEKLELRELRIRAIIMTGVALLRRGRADAAKNCFRELPEQAASLGTLAMMWRFGEALSAVLGNRQEMLARRAKWVEILRRLPEPKQHQARQILEQLRLPPEERAILRIGSNDAQLKTEDIAWVDVQGYKAFFDFVHQRLFFDGNEVLLASKESKKLLTSLVMAAPKPVDFDKLHATLFDEAPAGKPQKRVNPIVKELQKALKNCKGLAVSTNGTGLKLVPPKNSAILIPQAMEMGNLSAKQKKILKILRRFGATSINVLQEQCELNRAAARRELHGLVKLKMIEAVREGRGQAFRMV